MYEGLTLMLIGMSVVFVFLIILVAASSLMSAFCRAFFPEEVQPIASGKSDDGERVAAAIAAAYLAQNNSGE